MNWILTTVECQLSEEFTRYTIAESMRVAMPKVNRETLGDCYIALPPMHEQKEITDRIDKRVARIDVLIAKVREAIDKLREYRAALISAAVTGKIDVRDAIRSGG